MKNLKKIIVGIILFFVWIFAFILVLFKDVIRISVIFIVIVYILRYFSIL